MADAKATFAIGLETDGVVRPGDEAAEVLEKLKGKIQGDLKAIAQLNAAMRNLKASTTPNVSALRELKEKLDKHRQSLSSAQGDFVNLGGKLGDLTKKTAGGKASFKGFGDALASAGGPLGRSASSVRGMVERMGSMRLVALAAGAAVVAMAVAAAFAVGKIISFGIAAANASRAERLHLEGLVSIRNWYGLAAGKASDLQSAIDDVSASSSLGRDKIASYAEQLYKTGLRGQNLNDALEGTAIKASVQGEEMASMFVGAAAGANMAGASVKALADNVRTRLGGIAKAQALDLNVQIEKLHESFRQLFAGLNLERFLAAFNSITVLFSQSTITGRTLKGLLGGMFDPVTGAVEFAAPLMKAFFQGMIIGALDFEIAILRLRIWLKETFGGATMSNAKLLADFLLLGKIAAVTLLVAIGLLVAAFALIGMVGIGAVIIVVAAFKLLWAILSGIWMVIKGTGELLGNMAFLFVAGCKEIIAWAEKVGPEIVNGIGEWLDKAPALLGEKMKKMGVAIKKAFEGVLGIGSPSKVFAQYGVNVTEGLVGGLDQGAPRVDRSLQSMVTAPSMPAASGKATGAQAGAAGSSVNIKELHYHSSGRENHQADAEDFKTKLEALLEGVQIQLGEAS